MKKEIGKFLFTSSREINYPRNDLFIRSMSKLSKLDVVSPYRENISTGNYFRILYISFVNLIRIYLKLLRNKYSVIFVGFFGQLMILPISFCTKSPIFFDFFVSAFDTIVSDRKLIKESSIIAKLIFKIDQMACRNADIIFFDTNTNLIYFEKLFDLSQEKLRSVYVGCDETIFYPRTTPVDNDLVIYYSSYLPLHGVDIVIKAAKLLSDFSPIRFTIIGNGMEFNKIQKISNSLNLTNVSFIPSIPLIDLPEKIAEASICLGGHFGSTPKAKRVIAGKTFQLLAMRKPVIVGDNEANRELLTHGLDAWMCKMDDPVSLAREIYFLYNNESIRNKISAEGYITFKHKASARALEKNIRTEIYKKVKLN